MPFGCCQTGARRDPWRARGPDHLAMQGVCRAPSERFGLGSEERFRVAMRWVAPFAASSHLCSRALLRAPAVPGRRCSLTGGSARCARQGKTTRVRRSSTPSCRMSITEAAASATQLGSRSHRFAFSSRMARPNLGRALTASHSHRVWEVSRPEYVSRGSRDTRRCRDLCVPGVRRGRALGARSAPFCPRRQLATRQGARRTPDASAASRIRRRWGEARAHSGQHGIVQVLSCSPGARHPARHRHALGAHAF
jgi:hypothetical protein